MYAYPFRLGILSEFLVVFQVSFYLQVTYFDLSRLNKDSESSNLHFLASCQCLTNTMQNRLVSADSYQNSSFIRTPTRTVWSVFGESYSLCPLRKPPTSKAFQTGTVIVPHVYQKAIYLEPKVSQFKNHYVEAFMWKHLFQNFNHEEWHYGRSKSVLEIKAIVELSGLIGQAYLAKLLSVKGIAAACRDHVQSRQAYNQSTIESSAIRITVYPSRGSPVLDREVQITIFLSRSNCSLRKTVALFN
ncbi:hypothetical protein CROQUDRAFT_105770 [Cronartium quercuum f. sp. fusiforme G11]|uniref:Uncharacterized protein n=1 Tax=Cronartium quercuum f. sp. fusiforme G11 TaxID=708437 RepID=A0A9P6NMP3_9BASI|nr:hypothetical protein CROQUDRAFT_105770 [Cronartium quercuum f. sp. fusiforme G11]